MKKKLFFMASLLIIASLTLAACGGAAPVTEVPVSGDETASEGQSPEEAISLRLWTHQNDAFNTGLQELADAYSAEHPNVTITFETFDYDTYIQTLQSALPAGTEADILQMFGSWVCSYAQGGNLSQVPADVLTLEQAQEAIFPAQLAGYVCEEILYGIPQEFNIEYGAALVNTRLAAEAGLDNIPSPSTGTAS